MNKNRNQARDVGFYVLILLILLATVFSMTSQPETTVEAKDSDIATLLLNEQVKTVNAVGNQLTLELHEPFNDSKIVEKELFSIQLFRDKYEDLIQEQKEKGIIEEYNFNKPWTPPMWMNFLPYLGAILIFGIFWYFMMKTAAKGGGGGVGAAKFGKARTRLGTEEKKKITFNDVAGADEEKEELQEIVGFLRSPASYTALGARIPKGVLLVGPPGTGKTLIAKAVAGEAGVQFLSISGSDFVELYVGVGASRVRDLFEQAKKIAPAIIFIDEIDAVGRQRGSGLGGGHDEREQTLNQLLVEMDGFGNNDGVIVIAATNRADILDSALLRPGRFDRTVYVGMPDVRGREAILKVHARGKPLGDDVNLNSIARGTPGFSGADLENLLNEAAILTVRRDKRFITQSEIDESILKVIAGPEKRSRVMSDQAKKLTAYHEAGHAVVGHFLKPKEPVQYITIVPRGPSGGMTVYRPSEDKESYQAKGEMFADIVVSLAGRVAERLMLDDISTGASGDIQSATKTARAMVTTYGFSDRLGPISFEDSGHSIFIGRDFGTTKSYSEETAAIIDEEVKRIFDEAGKRCEEVLNEHREMLIAVAEYLLENETMEGEDFKFLCENGYLPEKKKAEQGGEHGQAQEIKADEVKSDEVLSYRDIADGLEGEKPQPDEKDREK